MPGSDRRESAGFVFPAPKPARKGQYERGCLLSWGTPAPVCGLRSVGRALAGSVNTRMAHARNSDNRVFYIAIVRQAAACYNRTVGGNVTSKSSSMGELVMNPLPHGGQLVCRSLDASAAAKLRKEAADLPSLILDPVGLSDLEMLAVGAYSPLVGFMGAADYDRVLKEMRLAEVLFGRFRSLWRPGKRRQKTCHRGRSSPCVTGAIDCGAC